MRVIFMGTPDFAQPTLLELCKSGHEIVAVFTQPDRPRGRGQKTIPPVIKVCAEKNDIPVYQPKSMRSTESIRTVKDLNPDVIVVVAFGQILPKEVLDIPKYGCINIHASLLPKYRGAAPIQWVILDGETETGVMSMQMDVGLDTGDIIKTKRLTIGENETAEELFERLSIHGATLLIETLEAIENGTATRTKQSEVGASYAGRISRKLSPIDWNKPAQTIHNQVRGLYSWPIADTCFKGMRLRVHESRMTDIKTTKATGTVLDVSDGIVVACGDGRAIRLTRVQADGRKCLHADDFLCGYTIHVGEQLDLPEEE